MNSPDVTRGMTLALMIVLVIIPENFTVISPLKKYLPAFTIIAHPESGLVLA
jgi:hypothetical protein